MKAVAIQGAFTVGEYIAEELEARGMSKETFCQLMEKPTQWLDALTNGSLKLVVSDACKLERLLGPSFLMWLNLDKAYEAATHKATGVRSVRSARLP